jgi:hypothetical protein
MQAPIKAFEGERDSIRQSLAAMSHEGRVTALHPATVSGYLTDVERLAASCSRPPAAPRRKQDVIQDHQLLPHVGLKANIERLEPHIGCPLEPRLTRSQNALHAQRSLALRACTLARHRNS